VLEIVRISPEVHSGGYVAMRHALIANLIQVNAPCGCTLLVNSKSSVLTQCEHDCAFSWTSACDAVAALAEMEDASGRGPQTVQETLEGQTPDPTGAHEISAPDVTAAGATGGIPL
jgi:hypothetical protein